MLMMNVVNKSGYFFDADTLTLHMTKAYEKRTLVYGSPECSLVLNMKRQFPEMKIEVHKRKPSSNKPLPYKLMKKYVAIMPNANAMLEEFERVQKMSVAFKSPYKFVEKWFKEQFPNYKMFVKYDEEGNPVWKVADLMVQAKEEAEAANQNEEQTDGNNDAARSKAEAAQQTNSEDAEAEDVAAPLPMVG